MDPLPTGSKVYISAEGIQNKLNPKYSGPFTIVKQTPKGNFIVKNVLGQKLKTAFPLCRFKIAKSDPNTKLNENETFFEVESILDHRHIKGGYEFLIKWKGKSNKDISWEPGTNFADNTAINNYWQKIGKPTSKKRVRPPKPKPTINLILLVVISTLFGFFDFTTGLKVKDNFYACDTPDPDNLHNTFLKIPTHCSFKEKNESFLIERNESIVEAKVLIKAPYLIFGEGTQCQLIKIQTYKGFFGSFWTKIDKYPITLTHVQ